MVLQRLAQHAAAHDLAQPHEGLREAQNQTHLGNHAALALQRDQRLALLGVKRQRLLDEAGYIALQQPARDREMCGGRRGDDGAAPFRAAVQRGVQAGETAHAQTAVDETR
ncbi:MAG: hypothetical protein NTW37_06845 [Proteobacteria bacterium]|nr:hypothetical protein [Pseudomonadota bacterium]